jgi:hypothetical protein
VFYPFYMGEIEWRAKLNSPGQEMRTAVKGKDEAMRRVWEWSAREGKELEGMKE